MCDLRELSYFKFTSRQFCEDAWEMIENVIKDVVNTFQNLLISKCGTEKKVSIEAEAKELESLFLESAKACKPKLQTTAKDIFALPSNLLIPGCGQEGQVVTDEEVEALRNEVEELEIKYLQEIQYHEYLKTWVEAFNLLKPMCEESGQQLELHKKFKTEEGVKCFKELFDTLRKFQDFFFKKEEPDQLKTPIVDKYNMFKKK